MGLVHDVLWDEYTCGHGTASLTSGCCHSSSMRLNYMTGTYILLVVLTTPLEPQYLRLFMA